MRRARLWWALALGLGLAALLHLLAAAPPLFDGLPLPEAPYSYCTPPAGLKSSNVPPRSGQSDFPVQNGVVAGGSVQTQDAAPQVVLFIGVDELKVSPGGTSVRVRVDPVCVDPPPPPPGAQIVGNVYRLSAVEEPSGREATVNAAFHLTMRYPPGPFKELQLYDGTAWHPLETALAPAGNPYAGATLASLGELAATAAPGGESVLAVAARYLVSFGILALVILFGIIALVQEIHRRRRRQ